MTDLFDGLDEQLKGEKPPEWDPEPRERVYYRNTMTGDRGYLVRRGGRDVIRLDRPNEEIIHTLSPAQWRVDKEHRPLTDMQLAQVAYAADERLCFFLGEHDPSRKDWIDLSDKERIRWMRKGAPPDPRVRQVLWHKIMETLRPIAS